MTITHKYRALPLLLIASGLLVFSLSLAGSTLAAFGGSNEPTSMSMAGVVAPMDADHNATINVTNNTPHQPQTIDVSLSEYSFSPRHLTVNLGDTVVWTNHGSQHHTVTSGLFDSGDLRPGATFRYTFIAAGFVAYECTYHAISNNMTGDVTVNGGNPTPTPPAATPTLPAATLTPPAATPTAGPPTPTPCPNPFTDINGDPFFTAINALTCRGVVNGTTATTYSPNNLANRGELAKLIAVGFGIPAFTPTMGQSFTDVPPSSFAYSYVEADFHANVINGYDAATCARLNAGFPCFLPNHPITRGELTKLIVNAAHYLFTTPPSPTFIDVPPSYPFYTHIETAAAKGIINGYADHTFRPANFVPRDQMAQFVYMGITTPQ